MQLLTAVNLIMPKLGERPVTRVDSKHPTLAIILPVLDNRINEVLGRGWWFNTRLVDLFPDSEGFIQMPLSCLSFLNSGSEIIAARGDRMYSTTRGTYSFSGKVSGTYIERLDFEELPESMANFVWYSALVQIYMTDIGLEQVVGEWKALAMEAEAAATAEHLRNMKHSTRKSKRFGRLRSAMRG